MARVLLDTHVFLWWMDNDTSKVPSGLFELFRHRRNQVYLSVIVAWEIAIKAAVGKLKSPHKIEEAAQHYGFTVLPVSLSHVVALRALPLHHRDPFDRMLVAQAKVENLTLVSIDSRMRMYDISILPD